MTRGPAPILLFAYNRPEHLRRVLQALAANELAAESSCIICCDGPKDDAAAEAVAEVRAIAHAATGFASVTVIERERNMGLAPSIIDGVTRTLDEHGRVIVVEDDLLTSPYFLRYMNDGLELYADEPKVASIHGWCFPHGLSDPPESFFMRGADCWGWATWKRAWTTFEPDASKLLDQLATRGLQRAFNCDDQYDFVGMLRNEAEGRISSWAIRWHAATFLADMYTLTPGRSVVQNVGMDGTGTHCATSDLHKVELARSPIRLSRIPVAETPAMRQAANAFHGRVSGKTGNNGNDGTAGTKVRLATALRKRLPPSLIRALRPLRRIL